MGKRVKNNWNPAAQPHPPQPWYCTPLCECGKQTNASPVLGPNGATGDESGFQQNKNDAWPRCTGGLGAAELALVYGVVGAVMELTLGVDVPLIGLVDSSEDATSGCT